MKYNSTRDDSDIDEPLIYLVAHRATLSVKIQFFADNWGNFLKAR